MKSQKLLKLRHSSVVSNYTSGAILLLPLILSDCLAFALAFALDISPPSSNTGPTVEELVRIQQAQLQHHLRQLKLEQEETESASQSPLPNGHQLAGVQAMMQAQQIIKTTPQQRVASLIPEQLAQHQHRQNVARAVPRIVGPRLQRQKSKSSKVELGEADRRAVCPPGNDPLIDEESGRLRVCNGLEPHCPPKSYCYVTGVASADYNCCTVP